MNKPQTMVICPAGIFASNKDMPCLTQMVMLLATNDLIIFIIIAALQRLKWILRTLRNYTSKVLPTSLSSLLS